MTLVVGKVGESYEKVGSDEVDGERALLRLRRLLARLGVAHKLDNLGIKVNKIAVFVLSCPWHPVVG